MKLFKKKLKPCAFIERPQFNPKSPFITNVYRLIYLPEMSTSKMEAIGIDGEGRKLYVYVAKMTQNIIYQLYQIPSVRAYFGTEFIHGLRTEYDDTGNYIKFVNIDDTPEAEQFLKEIVLALEVSMHDFLIDKKLAIYFQGETFTIVSETSLPSDANCFYKQIAWQG